MFLVFWNMSKMPYFQRKYKEKHNFPPVIEFYFAIFAADFNKTTVIMIIGREKEQRELLELLDKEESQFCAVYGRWRVGKTHLIRETFNYQFCF